MSNVKDYSKSALESALSGYKITRYAKSQPPIDASNASIPPQVNPAVASATTTAVQNGADPAILNNAKKMLGDQNYIGLCERFVEVATQGKSGLYPSAIAAFNAQKGNATDLANAKPGDAIYFAPDASNEGFGHTGVISGNGNMISATNTGVKETPIDKWTANTGQKILGVIPKS